MFLIFRFFNDAKLIAQYYIAFKHILQYGYARNFMQISSFLFPQKLGLFCFLVIQIFILNNRYVFTINYEHLLNY